jgi:hypothetical protein
MKKFNIYFTKVLKTYTDNNSIIKTLNLYLGVITMEVKIQELRFGISVTSKSLLPDNEIFYNVRVPVELFGKTKEVYIECDSEQNAFKMAELIELGGMVTIKESL